MIDLKKAMDDADRYLDDLKGLIAAIGTAPFGEVAKALGKARDEGRMIFVVGNGGSAATANHFYCDFGKNAAGPDDKRFRICTLAEQVCAITALGNDCGYEKTFSMQLANLFTDGDVLISISASGNSPNVVEAAEYAKGRGGLLISLTGFGGGRLAAISDISLNVASDSYERVEDAHLAMCHMIVWMFKMQRKGLAV
ncbi:MAG: SIS domain-containing protein [Oscillospiraceae bacterium]|nr:SIS domain-containing protein [Oscillospiraceae bacterium]